jgi:hypothetical protein
MLPSSNPNLTYLKNHLSIISLGIFAALLAWLYQGYSFGHGNHGQEIPPILAMVDPTLFKNDFAVQDFLLPGTRYIYYSFIAFMSKQFDMSVDVILLLVKTLSQLSFYIALAYIYSALLSRMAPEGHTNTYRVMVLFALIASASTLPIFSWGSSIFYSSMIPSTLAMAIAIWSIFFAIHNRWNLAFSFSAMALLFQFLVGLHSALVLGPALIFSAFRARSFSILIFPSAIFLIPAVGVYLSTVLSDQSVPDSFDFLEVFGAFRVPHHWLPSTGSMYAWVSDSFLLVAAAISSVLLWQSVKRGRELIVLLAGAVVVSLAGIFLNFVFVEIYPISFIGKLQFQRIIPFGHLAVFFLVIANLYIVFWDKQKGAKALPKFLTVCSFILVMPSLFAIPVFRLFPGAAFLLILAFVGGMLIYCLLGIKAKVLLLSSSLSLLLLVNGSWFGESSGLLGKISKRYQPLYHEEWEGKEFSSWLRQNSSVDSLVIIPPYWGSVSDLLALHSQRSVFFSFKNVPYSEHGVWVWSQRAQELLGLEITSELTRGELVEVWRYQPYERLEAIAEKFEACYLVDEYALRSFSSLELMVTTTIDGSKWGLWKFPDC